MIILSVDLLLFLFQFVDCTQCGKDQLMYLLKTYMTLTDVDGKMLLINFNMSILS